MASLSSSLTPFIHLIVTCLFTKTILPLLSGSTGTQLDHKAINNKVPRTVLCKDTDFSEQFTPSAEVPRTMLRVSEGREETNYYPKHKTEFVAWKSQILRTYLPQHLLLRGL